MTVDGEVTKIKYSLKNYPFADGFASAPLSTCQQDRCSRRFAVLITPSILRHTDFNQTEGLGDDEGASFDMRGVPSDFCRSLFTLLDIVHTVDESAGGEERAYRPHPQPRRPPRRSRRGLREIARQRTSPKCSSMDTSATRSVLRPATAMPRKPRNIYVCFLTERIVYSLNTVQCYNRFRYILLF
jgi:hypothetical protein